MQWGLAAIYPARGHTSASDLCTVGITYTWETRVSPTTVLIHATCHKAAKPYTFGFKIIYVPRCPPTTLLRLYTTYWYNRLRSKPSIGEFGGAGYTRANARSICDTSNDGSRPVADGAAINADDDDLDDGF